MNREIKYPRFISNKPSGIDLFEAQPQNRLADAISEYITMTDNTENQRKLSRIIGLEGTWGAGKSNVIKLIKNKLKENYYVFEYDAWGHQEDLQRRSFLETLTTELIQNNFLNGKANFSFMGQTKNGNWDEKLKDLLARKTRRINKTFPKFNAGALLTVLFLSLTPITTFIAERLESACLIKNIIILTIIAVFPILLGLIIWGLLCIKNKEMRHLGYLLQISKDENVETENYEVINEDEPSVIKFMAWMNDISNYIEGKSKQKLIIVFDNMDRLPAEKVKELWSSIHTFFAEDGYRNIWTIIPFDERHLACAFGEGGKLNSLTNEDTVEEELIKYFIQKTFPIIYRVASPIITDFKLIVDKYFEESFGSTEKNFQDEVNRLFRIEYPSATVREIIAYINELVSLKTIWKGEIDIRSMAVYILTKDKLFKNTVQNILSGNYLSPKLKGFINNDEKLQRNISSLVYGISPKEAEQIPISKYIDGCLGWGEEGINYDINAYSTNKHFIDLLEDKIYSFSLQEIERVIISLNNLNINESNKARIQKLWNYLSQQRINKFLGKVEFTEQFKVLLIHSNKKPEIVEFLCKEFKRALKKSDAYKLNIANQKDMFNGANYYLNLQTLSEFLRSNKIEIQPDIENMEVNMHIFIDYLDVAENNYQTYKLKTDPQKLDEYFASLIPGKLQETRYLVLQYLIGDKNYQFPKTQEKIKEAINKNTIDQNNFAHVFFVYKNIQKEEGELPQKLNQQQITSLWSYFNSRPKDSGYSDILAMQLSTGVNISITLTEEQIKNVSECMDYYISYGDLLIRNLSWNNSSLKYILKYMTENRLGYTLSLGEVLPRFFEIKNHLSVSEETLLVQLDDWQNHVKEAVTKANIETIVPKELYAYTVKTKNDLTDYIHITAIEALKDITSNMLYQNRTAGQNYYWFCVMNALIDSEFLESLPINLIEFGRKVVMDIATGKQSIPDNTDIIGKIIEKIPISNLTTTIKDIRDEFCNKQYQMAPDIFVYLETRLREKGKLLERADRVTSNILQPILDNQSCLNLLLLHSEFYATIINEAGDDAIDFKENIRRKLENSDNQDLINFANKIGIQKNNNIE